jgi:hypothetical protein
MGSMAAAFATSSVGRRSAGTICWTSVSTCNWTAGLEASAATLRLSLLDERLEPSYVGDGRSGAAIGEIELRETAHFLQREESPW